MVKNMKKRFIFCGLVGWCLEIFWTGLKSLQRRQMKLMGHSSIWMFPIYGMAFLFAPISRLLNGKSVWVCPWDFSVANLNVYGVIRLDYTPVWFLTGLLYEKLLNKFMAS